MSTGFRARIMSDESSVCLAITMSASCDDASARFLHVSKAHHLAARVARILSTTPRAAHWRLSTGTGPAPVVVITLEPKGDVQLARDVAAAACVIEQIEIVRDASTEHLWATRGATVQPVPVGERINPMHLLAAPEMFDEDELAADVAALDFTPRTAR